MLKNKAVFEDGSEITWEDRDTLLYRESGKIVYVWIDFDSLFFGSRIIKLESMQHWYGTNEPISDEQKNDIIAKVRRYYEKKPVRVG
jgi:hypothetical protein